MGIDMKKEIKISDLWKRGPKEPKAEKPPKEPKQAKEPKPPKEKKERRLGRGTKEKVAAIEAKSGPPVRDIPLMRAFNLLPKEEVRAEKESKQSAIPHVIVALAGVLVFAALAAFYLSSSAGGDQEVRGARRSPRRPREPAGAREAAAGADRGGSIDSERSARTAALSTALADRLAWDRVLRELALVLPADVTLATLDATAPSPGSAGAATSGAVSSFRVTGTSVSQASVARLLSRLQVIPELQNVQLEFATASDDPAVPGVNFAITASVRQGAVVVKKQIPIWPVIGLAILMAGRGRIHGRHPAEASGVRAARRADRRDADEGERRAARFPSSAAGDGDQGRRRLRGLEGDARHRRHAGDHSRPELGRRGHGDQVPLDPAERADAQDRRTARSDHPHLRGQLLRPHRFPLPSAATSSRCATDTWPRRAGSSPSTP